MNGLIKQWGFDGSGAISSGGKWEQLYIDYSSNTEYTALATGKQQYIRINEQQYNRFYVVSGGSTSGWWETTGY